MTPRVSIVTTVYDRVECLERCVRSVDHLTFQDVEQIVVADHPPGHVEATLSRVALVGRTRVRYLNLPTRANDWGMTPAWEGARQATGEFVCFLSDDNAYLPGHFEPLIATLDARPDVGFVYSSCLYAGRTVLRTSPPMGARIDLGQPLFRRQVLLDAFPTGLPFHEFAWDWRMIDALVRAGVRWRHCDVQSFVFRLAAYPAIMEALA